MVSVFDPQEDEEQFWARVSADVTHLSDKRQPVQPDLLAGDAPAPVPDEPASDNNISSIRRLRKQVRQLTDCIESFRESFRLSSNPESVDTHRMTSPTSNLGPRRSSLRVTVPISSLDTDDVSPIGDAPSDNSPPDFARRATQGAHKAPTVVPGNTSGISHSTVLDTTILSTAHHGLLKRLVKSAKTYGLVKLDYQADPRARRDDFITWIEILQSVTETEDETTSVLENYPILPTVVEVNVNKVFAQLLRAYITKAVKNFLTSVNKNDGVEAIALLQKVFAPITHFDRTGALNDLNALYMFRNELVSGFMVRFHKKVSAVSSLTPAVGPHLTQFELIMMFLQKVERGVTNQDQRTIILGYKKDCQNCTDPSRPPCSLTAVEIELTELEARIACKLCGAIDHITRACPKRSVPVRRSHANMVSPATQYQMKCFKCGGNHRLSVCTKATQDEKNKIYGEKFPDSRPPVRQEFKQGRPSFRTNHPSKTFKSNQAEISPEKEEPKTQPPPKKSVLKGKQRAAPAWAKTAEKHKAQYVVHHASIAATVSTVNKDVHSALPVWDIQPDHQAKLHQSMRAVYHTVVQSDESNPNHLYSNITVWLIDSGCSNHMTPYLTDFIGDQQRASCSVEVATGVLTQAPLQGTVKIKLQDIYSGKWCYVLLHNVLYVPGLTRRLISVRQWNVTGGDVSFEMDHCTLTVCDATSGECEQYSVKPPYASTQQELQTPQVFGHEASPADVIPQKYIESSLLHRRMGHRSIPVLLHASMTSANPMERCRHVQSAEYAATERRTATTGTARSGCCATARARPVTRCHRPFSDTRHMHGTWRRPHDL